MIVCACKESKPNWNGNKTPIDKNGSLNASVNPPFSDIKLLGRVGKENEAFEDNGEHFESRIRNEDGPQHSEKR